MADISRIVNRQRNAAVALLKAIEEVNATKAERIALQDDTWVLPYFHQGGVLANPIRTDLDLGVDPVQTWHDITAGCDNVATAAAAYIANLAKAK